jgi:hypothetical protein
MAVEISIAELLPMLSIEDASSGPALELVCSAYPKNFGVGIRARIRSSSSF